MKIKKINIKKVTPMFTRIITTADTYTKEECFTSNGLEIPKKEGQIKDIQTILYAGDSAIQRGIKPGIVVSLDFRAYEVKSHAKDSLKEGMDEYYNAVVKLQVPQLTLDNKEVLYLDINDIEFIIDELDYDEVEINTSGIIQPSSLIIS